MDTNNNNSKSNYVLAFSILVAAILIAGAVIYSKGTGLSGGSANNQTTTNPFEVKKNDIVLGKDSAPVTIFLYSDPSCPFCAAADGGNQEVIDYLKTNMPTWTPAIPGLIDDYVNTGKARLIYRYYPGHGSGEEAMKILYCANEQGNFWQLNNAIAKDQTIVADAAKVKALAGSLGADVAKITSCVDSKKYDSKIAEDVELAKAAATQTNTLSQFGTPAFFVNRIPEIGAQPFSEFQKVIDTILKSK